MEASGFKQVLHKRESEKERVKSSFLEQPADGDDDARLGGRGGWRITHLA